MRKLYTLGIYLYTLGIRLAALFGHRNARLMVQGWPLTTGHCPLTTDHCPLTTDHSVKRDLFPCGKRRFQFAANERKIIIDVRIAGDYRLRVTAHDA